MAALLIASLSLVAVGFSARSASRGLQRSLGARAQLEQVLGLTTEAESGIRGFLLSAAPSSLDPYTAARSELPHELGSLGLSVGTDPAARARLAHLRLVVAADLRVLAGLRSLPVGTARSTLAPQLASEGAATGEVRSSVLSLERLMGAQVAASEADIAHADDIGFLVAALALALGLTFGLVASGLFASGVASRVRALQANADQLARGGVLSEMTFAADEVGRLGRALTRASALLAARDVALKAEHDFLEHLVSASPVVKFEGRNAFPGVGYVSPNLERVFGIPASSVASGAVAWLDRVHPGDRARVVAEADAAVRERSVQVESAYRLLDGDGSQRWVHSTTRLDYDASGVVAGLGVLLDVTESREAMTALSEREEMLRAIFDTSPDAIVVVDGEGSIAIASDAFESLAGWKVAETPRRSLFELLDPPAVRPVRAHIADALAGRVEDFFERMRLRSPNGSIRVVEGHGMPLSAADGRGALVLVLRDITEQTVLERKLFDASEAARKASHAKSEFLSRMSHELRTPLNAILGFAQLLGMDALGGDQQQSVHQIMKGGHHLLDLINEVLDISRIEAGRLTLSLERVAVAEVTSEVVELLAPLARGREINVVVGESVAAASVHADRQRLRQVLLNLVSNAIKYNEVGGSVEISCLPGRENTDIAVSDTGPGIPPDQAELVFAPFERLGAASSEIEGTGIGLTLSRHLTEAMGGSLRLSSAEIGTMFVVSLPSARSLAPPPLAPPPLAPPPLLGPSEAPTPAVRERAGAAARAAADPASRTAASTARSTSISSDHAISPDRECGQGPDDSVLPARCLEVLCVEDNLSNIRLLENTLERMPGVRLVVATTGWAALELARAAPPDLVLLDLHLPDIEGEEVLMRLRVMPETSEVPVVVLSADATETQVRSLLEAGAADYLTKPLDIERMFAAIRRVIDARLAVQA